MPKCEDWPCCGHGNHCPHHDENGEEIWTCTECGCKLPKKARSSICIKCQNDLYMRMEDSNF